MTEPADKTESASNSAPEQKPSRAIPPVPLHAPKRPPAPAASPTEGGANAARAKAPQPDPTRYGDWEKNGRCIDF